MSKEIKLGLPKGSLNTPGRGNTQQILINAGFDVRGYESGKESKRNLSIANDSEIKLFLTRPQSAPLELGLSFLDAAITGEDWIQEEGISRPENGVTRIGDLCYARTRLVIALPESNPAENLSDFFRARRGKKGPIVCFTEYVNLTRRAFVQNKAYQEIFGNQIPLIRIRGLTNGENIGVQIFNSDGITEEFIEKGADIVTDNTQTGSKLKEYGLRELEQILESSVGLYIGPSCIGWKREKAEEIFDQLKAATLGKE